jgi:hypothetical protein
MKTNEILMLCIMCQRSAMQVVIAEFASLQWYHLFVEPAVSVA